MSGLFGAIVYVVGIIWLLFSSFLGVSLKGYVQSQGQDWYVWPFFIGFIAAGYFICEVGRSMNGNYSGYLLLMELVVVFGAVTCYVMN